MTWSNGERGGIQGSYRNSTTSRVCRCIPSDARVCELSKSQWSEVMRVDRSRRDGQTSAKRPCIMAR